MTIRFLLLLGLVALPLGCAAGDDANASTDKPGTEGSRSRPDDFTRERGTLRSGDDTLTSGEFSDSYTFNAEPGQWIEVSMTSSAFDPYVILRPPSCGDGGGTCANQIDNDDFGADGSALVWHQATEGGRWSILATSHAPGESGDYELAYRTAAASEQPATPGAVLGSGRTERGQLGNGDRTLNSGEFVDSYGFVGRAGDRVTMDLRSTDFDPYLILQMPDDQQLDNDDWEGARDHARIEATLPADGAYRVLVTTYSVGESGAYQLGLTPGGGGSSSEGTSGKPSGGASGESGGGDPFHKD